MHQLFFFQKNIFFKPKMTGVSCIFQFCFFSKIIFQKLISAPLPPIRRVHLLKSIKSSSESKPSPHKNIPLTVAQHFPEHRRTLSRMYKNILLTAAQDFMAQYRLFCKHSTHKNTIELFSNIETCFTIFLPFVVHSLIIIFYKGLNFVYFPVI